jgi:hypothetical protein
MKPHDALAAYLGHVETVLSAVRDGYVESCFEERPGIDQILAPALTGIGVR